MSIVFDVARILLIMAWLFLIGTVLAHWGTIP